MILPNPSTVTVIDGTPLNLGPGLAPAGATGIDFDHLAFLQRQGAIQAIIDPVTQNEIALFGRFHRTQPISFFPIFGGFEGAPMVIEAPPAQVVVVEQPAPAVGPVPQEAPALAAPTAAAPPETPLPDLGQFLLVRRDGSVIESIAFSLQGSEIIYITADGDRHIIGVDQIDLRATEQRNAEKGTFLHLQR